MVRVSVGIILQDNLILYCQRLAKGSFPLLWEFPGGKVIDNETPVQALLRELNEELSITTTVEPILLYHHTAEYLSGSAFEVNYFLVQGISGSPVNNVFEQIRWIAPETAKEYKILEGNREFCEKLPLLLHKCLQ